MSSSFKTGASWHPGSPCADSWGWMLSSCSGFGLFGKWSGNQSASSAATFLKYLVENWNANNRFCANKAILSHAVCNSGSDACTRDFRCPLLTFRYKTTGLVLPRIRNGYCLTALSLSKRRNSDRFWFDRAQPCRLSFPLGQFEFPFRFPSIVSTLHLEP